MIILIIQRMSLLSLSRWFYPYLLLLGMFLWASWFCFDLTYHHYFAFYQVLLTIAEHHSAIVPWQLVAQQTGASLKYIGLTKEQVPDVDQLKKLLSKKTKLVVTHHVSNTLGIFQSFLILSIMIFFVSKNDYPFLRACDTEVVVGVLPF